MKNFTISNFKIILKNVSKLSTLSFNIISNQVEFILFIISINFKKKNLNNYNRQDAMHQNNNNNNNLINSF